MTTRYNDNMINMMNTNEQCPLSHLKFPKKLAPRGAMGEGFPQGYKLICTFMGVFP